MAAKRRSSTSVSQVVSKTASLGKIPRSINLDKVTKFLTFLFLIIWIPVGLFFVVFIYGNFRQGAFNALFAKPAPPPQAAQAPTETTLPGIGKVNIACVQGALNSAAIQKIVTDGNTSKLTAEEKAKFEPCVVEKEDATPSSSDSPSSNK